VTREIVELGNPILRLRARARNLARSLTPETRVDPGRREKWGIQARVATTGTESEAL